MPSGHCERLHSNISSEKYVVQLSLYSVISKNVQHSPVITNLVGIFFFSSFEAIFVMSEDSDIMNFLSNHAL